MFEQIILSCRGKAKIVVFLYFGRFGVSKDEKRSSKESRYRLHIDQLIN